MKALLLVAHGSRLSHSNEEVIRLRQRLADRLTGEFKLIDCAFLELTQPSVAEGIDACVAQGCQRIILLPYFLAAGRHIRHDIPAIVAAKQAQYPHISIHTAPYLGQSSALVDALAELALEC